MELHITEEELVAVETYLNRAETENINSTQFLQSGVKNTHPVLIKLLQYGIEENKQIPTMDRNETYQQMLNMSDDAPEHLLHFAITYPDTIRGLASRYRAVVEDAERHRIFSKKLSDMTGYEYQKYKKMIGE